MKMNRTQLVQIIDFLWIICTSVFLLILSLNLFIHNVIEKDITTLNMFICIIEFLSVSGVVVLCFLRALLTHFGAPMSSIYEIEIINQNTKNQNKK